ncbi:ABC transporter ATP-binding protein [Microcella alkalica]|uniref:ABC-type quaternary amine transporter n=1 Tax=Microcella alkalica TaxID=355930 RepID=A0A839E9F7_9MICO|nr:ABC transporter ATP-binding protein [Microcella alkalica]MBA8847886.1 putative spermidine/putrescine transport system ATP-binding protein [Microcella alkalica]
MTATPAAPARISATVSLRGVVKRFPGLTALDGVSLDLAPGEFVALLGPSGCGKTTALRVLAGLEAADEGSILIDGDDVIGTPTNKRDIGMVFQSYSLFPHLTTIENVEFGLRMRRVPAADRRSRAAEALELVGLDHHAGRYAHQLSGGQQQRVALARALVTRPRVLLLDEPLSALDAKVRVQLRDEIRRIQTELGITTLFVTHDQEEALAVADRVAVMRDGRIEQIGSPEELYARPASAFVADFVGLSNRMPGCVVDDVVLIAGQPLPLLDPDSASGDVHALVRPEDVELVDAHEAGAHAGRVLTTSFLGAFRRTRILLDGGAEIIVQHAAGAACHPGDRVHVRLTGRPVAVAPR